MSEKPASSNLPVIQDQERRGDSYLFGGNAPYVEELYEAYLSNPASVEDNWRSYFDAMQHAAAVDGSNRPDVDHSSVIASFAECANNPELARKSVAVTQLITDDQLQGGILWVGHKLGGSSQPHDWTRLHSLLDSLLEPEQSVHESAAAFDPNSVAYGTTAHYEKALRSVKASRANYDNYEAVWEPLGEPAQREVALYDKTLAEEISKSRLLATSELPLNSVLHDLEDKVFSGEFALKFPADSPSSYMPACRSWPKEKRSEPYEL